MGLRGAQINVSAKHFTPRVTGPWPHVPQSPRDTGLWPHGPQSNLPRLSFWEDKVLGGVTLLLQVLGQMVLGVTP